MSAAVQARARMVEQVCRRQSRRWRRPSSAGVDVELGIIAGAPSSRPRPARPARAAGRPGRRGALLDGRLRPADPGHGRARCRLVVPGLGPAGRDGRARAAGAACSPTTPSPAGAWSILGSGELRPADRALAQLARASRSPRSSRCRTRGSGSATNLAAAGGGRACVVAHRPCDPGGAGGRRWRRAPDRAPISPTGAERDAGLRHDRARPSA